MTTKLPHPPTKYCADDAALKINTASDPTLTYVINSQDKQITELAATLTALIGELQPVSRPSLPHDDCQKEPAEDLPLFVGAIAWHNKRLSDLTDAISHAASRLAI